MDLASVHRNDDPSPIVIAEQFMAIISDDHGVLDEVLDATVDFEYFSVVSMTAEDPATRTAQNPAALG